jgi:hypothetical protein
MARLRRLQTLACRLFDHLVGLRQQQLRHGEAERLGRRAIAELQAISSGPAH